MSYWYHLTLFMVMTKRCLALYHVNLGRKVASIRITMSDATALLSTVGQDAGWLIIKMSVNWPMTYLFTRITVGHQGQLHFGFGNQLADHTLADKLALIGGNIVKTFRFQIHIPDRNIGIKAQPAVFDRIATLALLLLAGRLRSCGSSCGSSSDAGEAGQPDATPAASNMSGP